MFIESRSNWCIWELSCLFPGNEFTGWLVAPIYPEAGFCCPEAKAGCACFRAGAEWGLGVAPSVRLATALLSEQRVQHVL